ncbi:MAG TPA: beta-phosphoglucomutase family hydrolase [Streptosporangiaceae bacterium]|nr:beta-phosphoglucomutase family hydrolase [Streptosporangiaceae bacterium]
MLGIPDRMLACLFDLDGVLTRTADLHAAAWKAMFDDYLRGRAQRTGTPFVPFDAHEDYDRYVDGMPRADGTASFLASRQITLPTGHADDPPGTETVHGLGNRKNEIVLATIAEGGVQVIPGSLRYLTAVRQAGLATAVVSASANCQAMLAGAGIAGLADVVVDGVVAAREHLAGKPAPDTYLAASRELRVPPERAVVYEDALAGVAAGRAGGFGWVVGVDRDGQAAALRAEGADDVVSDLADLLGRP